MKRKLALLLTISMAALLPACQSVSSQSGKDSGDNIPQEDVGEMESGNVQGEEEELTLSSKEGNLSGTVPDELECIPAEYKYPAEQAGTLEKLTYQTWESFSYEDHTQELTKEAWVYLPYGYSEEQKYNVFYLSHGGWSNETTIM